MFKCLELDECCHPRRDAGQAAIYPFHLHFNRATAVSTEEHTQFNGRVLDRIGNGLIGQNRWDEQLGQSDG